MAGTRARKPRLRRISECQLYRAGHTVHYIQALRSQEQPSRVGRLAAAEGNHITVDFGDTESYLNHDVERLLGIIKIGWSVRVCERYRILQGAGGHCFSIANPADPLIPCDFEPLRSASPGALSERLKTHGGFLVPGQRLLAEQSGGGHD